MTRPLIVTLMVVALAGCGHASGSFLPPIKAYNRDFQREMKAELQTVRSCCPNTTQFVTDSIKLRDKIRSGQAIQDKEGGGFRPFGGLFKNR